MMKVQLEDIYQFLALLHSHISLIKIIIIKKNYKNHNDEISLIKKYNKILVSKKRTDAINEAIEKKFNFAVLDDGYQDLSIKKNLRNLKILI